MKTKEKIIKELEGKRKIECVATDKGVTIWVNGEWILDASCFMEDERIRIDFRKLGEQKEKEDFKGTKVRIFELKYREENEN